MNTREFKDTIPVQRREPMPFEPMWYRRRNCVAACYGQCDQGRCECQTPDACRLPEDSDFGAMEGLAKGYPYIAAAWLAIAVVGALVWWLV